MKDACPDCGERVFISDETFAIDKHFPEDGVETSGWVNTCKNCGASSVHHTSNKTNEKPTKEEDKVIGQARAIIAQAKNKAEANFKKSKEFSVIKKSPKFKAKAKANPQHEERVLRAVAARETQELRFRGIWQQQAT